MREFSVARTPSQNRVTERKNRTLIEATRTMLADSLLPIPFWAQAVNTACYAQNRVLVTKPHNKTSYELLIGRTPSIGFMRPFRCPVTILNTLDPLGKFDGKADKGFLVEYSVSSKAFRVFNSRTRIVQETLHINFLENQPNVARNRPTCPSDNDVSLTFEIGGKSSFVDPFQYPDDPDMPALEDIVYSDDEEDVGAEADFSNLETNITVSLIPTTRVHKDHHVTLIIGDLTLAPQTRSMARMEEGIDYEEVFVPLARIEAIWLFLAYASFMSFRVYQMDVKSAFLYGTIKEEVYVCQPLGFEDPDYPDKVYKVVKALYGLHQAPRAWDDIIFGSTNKKLCKAFEMLMKDKFQISSMDSKSTSTLIDTEKPLLKDPDGKDMDVHIYMSMIGSLMYLTSSRPDIMFVIYACAHFYVTSKVSHLHAVKRIFRYFKGKPYLGLRYTKDFPFNLGAYYDSDYARASLDRKSTTGGCQFLEDTIRQNLRLDDADGVDCLPNEEIFAELSRMGYEKLMVRNVDSPSKFLMYPRFLQVMINAQIDDLSSYNTKYPSPTLTQKVFTNMRRIGKVFLGVETPLFDTMLVQPQVQDVVKVNAEDEDDNEVSVGPIPPSPTPATTPPPPQQEPIPSPSQAQSAQPSSPQ
nr:hypothetical protein [Tanacetum cinerariifolium]